MVESEQLKQFYKDYERYELEVLQPTCDGIRAVLKPWVENRHYWARYLQGERKRAQHIRPLQHLNQRAEDRSAHVARDRVGRSALP